MASDINEKRSARVLLLLANFGKEGKPEAVIPNITQETLAEMIGTTRSRVELLYEEIPEVGLHRVQWKIIGPFVAAQRRATRTERPEHDS